MGNTIIDIEVAYMTTQEKSAEERLEIIMSIAYEAQAALQCKLLLHLLTVYDADIQRIIRPLLQSTSRFFKKSSPRLSRDIYLMHVVLSPPYKSLQVSIPSQYQSVQGSVCSHVPVLVP